LARQLRPCLDALAAESGPLTLIEWGPGDGQLMRDLIAGIGVESPAWLDRLELVLVESSPALQARQRQPWPAQRFLCTGVPRSSWQRNRAAD